MNERREWELVLSEQLETEAERASAEGFTVIPLDDLLEDERLHRLIAAPHPAETKPELAPLLEDFIDSLPNENVRKAVRLRYGLLGDDPKTFKEIGHVLGVSGSWARQRVTKGLEQLRHPRRSRKLRGYWYVLDSEKSRRFANGRRKKKTKRGVDTRIVLSRKGIL